MNVMNTTGRMWRRYAVPVRQGPARGKRFAAAGFGRRLRRLLHGTTLTFIVLLCAVAVAAFTVALSPNAPIPSYVYDNFQTNTIRNGDWHPAAEAGRYALAGGMLQLSGTLVSIQRPFHVDPQQTVVLVRVRPRHPTVFGASLKNWIGRAVSVEMDAGGFKCGHSTPTSWWAKTFLWWPPRLQAKGYIGRWFTIELAVVRHPFHATCLVYDADGLLLGQWTFRHFGFSYGDLNLLALGTQRAGALYDITSVYAGPVSAIPALGLSQSPPHLAAVSPVAADGSVTVSGAGQPGEVIFIHDNGATVARVVVAAGGIFTATFHPAAGVNAIKAVELTGYPGRVWPSNTLTVTL